MNLLVSLWKHPGILQIKCVSMHDGQWKAALRRAWSFISRLVCQNIHPWKDSSWTLCRFGCGLHTLSSGTDNPVSKLFRWDHWFLLCQDSDIWFLMFIFLYLLVQIPTNRPEIQIGKLAMSWCEDRKSGVYQEARVPRECDKGDLNRKDKIGDDDQNISLVPCPKSDF